MWIGNDMQIPPVNRVKLGKALAIQHETAFLSEPFRGLSTPPPRFPKSTDQNFNQKGNLMHSVFNVEKV